MLPCNVVVRDAGDGQTEVAAIDPVASMQAIDNPALKEAARVVRSKLDRVRGSAVSATDPGFRDRLLFDSVRQHGAARSPPRRYVALSSVSVIGIALRLRTVRRR